MRQKRLKSINAPAILVNYPAHRAGHLKELDEGDCIPLTPTPHSSPSTGRGILREDFINQVNPMAESLGRHLKAKSWGGRLDWTSSTSTSINAWWE